MDVWIGTSGYSYPNWLGEYYPRGTRPGQMLALYCQDFPLVELNFTFYRLPTAGMLSRLADKAPPGFQFLVKVPQTISHEESDRDLPAFRDAVAPLQNRGQLKGVLVQLPQRTHCKRFAVERVAHLGRQLDGLQPAIEFRHHSWDRPRMPAWLANQGLDLVAVDVPDIPALFPRGWVQSSPRAYIRLHSRNADKWYAGETERYDFEYTDAQLAGWSDAMHAHAGGTRETLLLFNNCQQGQAVVNARRMQELLHAEDTGFHVVPPSLPIGPRQRPLFE